MAHSKSLTSCFKIHLSCPRPSAIFFCFTVSMVTMTLPLMSWQKTQNSPTKCPIKKTSNSSMLSFFRRPHQKSHWESWISSPIATSTLWDSSLRAFKMPGLLRIMKGSKNPSKSLMSACKNTFPYWCLKPKSIGIKKIIQLSKSSLGRVLNFVLIMRLGNWTLLMSSSS